MMGVNIREKPKGSGTWWLFINHQGQRKAKKIGRDKKLAREVAAKIEARLALGELVMETAPCPTFKEYSERWLEFIKATRRSSTHERYESILRIHIHPTLGVRCLDEVKRGEIRDLLIEKGKTLSKSTVDLIRDVLGGIFAYALDEELIKANPTLGITKLLNLGNHQLKITPLTGIEQTLFLDTCRNLFPRHYPFFLFLLRTGARLGEALGLKWGDIDWESGFVWIKRTYRRGVLNPPKNGKARRIRMTPQLSEVLMAHFKVHGDAGGMVFGKDGGPWEQNDAREVLKKVLGAAEMRHVRVHDLRHTWVTHRLSLGHNIVDVSREAGHSSIKITVDAYYHWLPDNSSNEIDQLDQAQTQPTATQAQPGEIPESHKSKFLH